jgi:hypothetical protein
VGQSINTANAQTKKWAKNNEKLASKASSSSSAWFDGAASFGADIASWKKNPFTPQKTSVELSKSLKWLAQWHSAVLSVALF